jgi:hypothetical protein
MNKISNGILNYIRIDGVFSVAFFVTLHKLKKVGNNREHTAYKRVALTNYS